MNDTITVTDDAIEIELAAPKAKTKKQCLCGLVRIDFPAANLSIEDLPKKYRDYAELNAEGYDDGGWIHLETGCEELTAKLFAPGHDARFKGLLQCAHRQGGDVTFVSDGLSITQDPIDFAIEHTPNLVGAIQAEVAPRAAAKPRAKKNAEPVLIQAQVGRWIYEGTIDKTTGNFIYIDGKGESKMTSNFKEVTEA